MWLDMIYGACHGGDLRATVVDGREIAVTGTALVVDARGNQP
jgi:hypothetical protein